MKTTLLHLRCAALAGLAAAVVTLCGCAGGLPAFDLEGHRGARGLAPENTLAAFDTALAIGVTTLELDTVVSADGVVVISHDTQLNPNFTRDADGQWLAATGAPIRNLTLAQLKRYDIGRLQPGTRYAQAQPEQRAADGQRIPTLDELFERVEQRGDVRVRFNIETKSSPSRPELTPEPQPFVEALLAVIRRHGMERRVMLQSFDWRTLQVAQRLAPRIPTVYLSSQQGGGNNIADPRWTAGMLLADHGSVPKMVKAAGGAVWSPNFADVTPELVREAQSLGLKVVVWTVNEPAQIEKALQMRVDGIISDRPDRVRAAMAARGMSLP
jgi:glycerophosphoryl diester phosphodiesterase